MDDFSAKPGVPNLYGLTGTEANSIAPGKRMLSSMTPTIVEKDNKLFMVVGTQEVPRLLLQFYKLS
jgi:gamma-glutamyltranspeptidase/glutathione hydrolase